MQTVKGRTIYVGLSGGVDSAVSAALLQKAGASVTGVFIKGWYPPGMPCTWAKERRDAMRVAARLGIAFQTLDASREYKEGVIDYLVSEYRAGRTPNPDVMCNREVKFGAFYRCAIAQGADAIAMGHYRSGEKDQSYFLWAVPKEILEATLFPVGALTKEKVRALATAFRLPVATKPDSQGICFLGSVSVDEFLRSVFSVEQGQAVTEAGETVGTHGGALLATLGQRVALSNAREPGPWYVVAKHIEQNVLVVSHTPRGHGEGTPSRIRLCDTNWVRDCATATHAQYRYRGPRIAGTIDGDTFHATDVLQEHPAPGQSLVLYDTADRLVGGGRITL